MKRAAIGLIMLALAGCAREPRSFADQPSPKPTTMACREVVAGHGDYGVNDDGNVEGSSPTARQAFEEELRHRYQGLRSEDFAEEDATRDPSIDEPSPQSERVYTYADEQGVQLAITVMRVGTGWFTYARMACDAFLARHERGWVRMDDGDGFTAIEPTPQPDES